MRLKGALPVPHIIAIIVGLAIIGLLGYWLFILASNIPKEWDSQKCMQEAYKACQNWKTFGWMGDITHFLNLDSYQANCVESGLVSGPYMLLNPEDDCKQILGINISVLSH